MKRKKIVFILVALIVASILASSHSYIDSIPVTSSTTNSGNPMEQINPLLIEDSTWVTIEIPSAWASNYDYRYPSLDIKDGIKAVAWYDNSPSHSSGYDYDIFFRRYNLTDGTFWWGVFLL